MKITVVCWHIFHFCCCCLFVLFLFCFVLFLFCFVFIFSLITSFLLHQKNAEKSGSNANQSWKSFFTIIHQFYICLFFPDHGFTWHIGGKIVGLPQGQTKNIGDLAPGETQVSHPIILIRNLCYLSRPVLLDNLYVQSDNGTYIKQSWHSAHPLDQLNQYLQCRC